MNKNTKEREYLDYPPKMEFTLFYKNDRLETEMFSWKGEKLPNDSDIKAKSRVKFIAAWFSLTRGTFGLTMKYLLLTEFEGRTVSYGPSFFLLDLWLKREARGP